jgi:hypothetical protein
MTQTGRRPDDEVGEEKHGGEDNFLATARKRFARAVTAESMNRSNAVDDLRFKNGEQWPETIKQQRAQEKRPCLTINKMKTFVHQITNDQRQNRPAINVSPVGDGSDPETAKMLKGLIRQIERQSNADVAYDTAFDGAVSNGWGFWRIVTEYEGDDTFDQVLRVKRIRNPFRVYLDPDRQEPDASDAEWGFITDLVTKAEFKDTWPDADQCEWDATSIGEEYKNWVTETHIRIAEYFCKKTKKRKLLAISNGHIGYEDELAPELKELIKLDPSLIVNERDVRAERWCWYKITAKEILEEVDWLGKWMPIVECVGDEIDVEGKVTKAGLIRDAKDAQRMYNFWCTSETEMIALAPKAPWVMEEGQVEGHENRWKEANVKSLPYLLYKGTTIGGKPAPAPERQQFAGPPAAIVQAKIGAAQDMQAATGIRFDATLNERMYDESGKALRELKRVGDLGNFHYIDNLARSLRHTGRILIDLIPKVYDTKRVLTIIREDDSEEQVAIDPALQQSMGEEKTPDGKTRSLFNPKVGEYDVAVTIGPSYATKRAEAADSMLGFMKAVPQAGQFIGDLIAKNMDWPGAEEISARLAAMLPPNLQNMSVGKFPPEAQAMIQGLKGQLEQMSQEHQQALAMLGDKEADRAIEREKIAKDFEAKLTKIAADMQTALLDMQAASKEDNQAQVEKVALDFEAKVLKVVADLEAKRIATESNERLALREQQLAQQQAEAQNKEDKPEKGPPAIHIHMPSGKKRITKGKDGSYTAEDVE